jgi:3-isopropylmalate dehydratase small subunit
VDLEAGTVTNETTGETVEGERLPGKAMDILSSGGGIEYAKKHVLQGEG